MKQPSVKLLFAMDLSMQVVTRGGISPVLASFLVKPFKVPSWFALKHGNLIFPCGSEAVIAYKSHLPGQRPFGRKFGYAPKYLYSLGIALCKARPCAYPLLIKRSKMSLRSGG